MTTQICSKDCPCRTDLDRAAAALAEASVLLAESTSNDSHELIENCYAQVRVAKARFQGAYAIYLEHRTEAAAGMRVTHTFNRDEKAGAGSS